MGEGEVEYLHLFDPIPSLGFRVQKLEFKRIQSTDSLRNLKKLKDKYTEANTYICKNLFFFYVDKDSTFGTTNENLVFVPVNYSIKDKTIANTKYRINNLPEEYKEWIPKFENQLEKLRDYQEDIRTNIGSMIESPIK